MLTTVIKPKATTKAITIENELFEYVFGDEFYDLQLLEQTDNELELLAKEILGSIEKLMV